MEKLRIQAKRIGGKIISLLGNHEIMNIMLDFRYVFPEGYKKFAKFKHPISNRLKKRLINIPKYKRGRAIAFFPGGPVNNILSTQNVAVIVGKSVFVHGGIIPKWARYGISKINQETRSFITGKVLKYPVSIGNDGLVWSRHFSQNTGPKECKMLKESLRILGLKRMVVAHTVHLEGINSACGEKVWRVDVGMSHHYGGKAQALEIIGDKIKILK